MNKLLIQKLESKIYGFSVNVFSFVKSMNDSKISIRESNTLLTTANCLYSDYLDVMDMVDKGKNPDLSVCMNKAEECSSILYSIELSGKLLNEKVDLQIEANEILRKLKEL